MTHDSWVINIETKPLIHDKITYQKVHLVVKAFYYRLQMSVGNNDFDIEEIMQSFMVHFDSIMQS